jgi:hypothetical protein
MYRWVYRTDDMMGNTEHRYDSAPEYPHSPDYPGSLTLSFPSEKAHVPENFTGSLHLIDLKGTFTGVKQVEMDDEPSVNCWEIERVHWQKNCSNEMEEGHLLQIYDLADDDGNKFIAFVWNQGWWGCVEHISTCLAKKQTNENALVGLTDGERDRMGMYLSDSEVEKRAFVKERNIADSQGRSEQGSTGEKRKLEDEEKGAKQKRKI